MVITPKPLVERLYHEVWNLADEQAAAEILDPGFRFRSSLSLERFGARRFRRVCSSNPHGTG